MKSQRFLILLLLLFTAGVSCSNVVMAKNDFKENSSSNNQNGTKEFSEERRLNRDVELKEYLIVKTFEETLDVYTKLHDKRFSRSAPIPTLFDNEFLIVLKPKLKKLQYGDIEVIKIEEKNSVLNIFYKEIDNSEYLLNKEKNPIVILRLKGNIPSDVKLIPTKN